MKFYKKHRRYFVLLEILIAFSLVALCIFPLVYSQFSILKSEKELNKSLNNHRKSNSLFCDVVEKLYKKQISPNQGLISFEDFQVNFVVVKRKESSDVSFYILKTTIDDELKFSRGYYLFVESKEVLS